MTRMVSVLQVGVGQVGSAVVGLVTNQAPRWLADYDIDVRYHAVADSTAFVSSTVSSRHAVPRLAADQLAQVLADRASGQQFVALPDTSAWSAWEHVLNGALQWAESPENLVVLDCASGSATTPLLLAARTAGAHVVLANKDPLVGPQAQYCALAKSDGCGSLHNSATVGAGLPVAATLRALTASGDTLLELSAQASGSLGFICSALSSGATFDAAVRQAAERGFTEPDPRQDLSGFDVARKLLILARSAGAEPELSDVQIESLVPPGAQDLSADDFTATLSDYSDFLTDRIVHAQAGGRVLRYAARIDQDGALSASLQDFLPDDPLARGHGPDNVFILRTTRYRERPLVIAGPGAGVNVTAGAVVADLLRAVGVL